jgi:hypothetical protein
LVRCYSSPCKEATHSCAGTSGRCGEYISCLSRWACAACRVSDNTTWNESERAFCGVFCSPDPVKSRRCTSNILHFATHGRTASTRCCSQQGTPQYAGCLKPAALRCCLECDWGKKPRCWRTGYIETKSRAGRPDVRGGLHCITKETELPG